MRTVGVTIAFLAVFAAGALAVTIIVGPSREPIPVFTSTDAGQILGCFTAPDWMTIPHLPRAFAIEANGSDMYGRALVFFNAVWYLNTGRTANVSVRLTIDGAVQVANPIVFTVRSGERRVQGYPFVSDEFFAGEHTAAIQMKTTGAVCIDAASLVILHQ